MKLELLWRTLLVVAICAIKTVVVVDGAMSGIPGTTQTESGYDTEMGRDPMCWSSVASPSSEEGVPFPNGDLVANYAVADMVKLKRKCPDGTTLEAEPPQEFLTKNFQPRTRAWYNYRVRGSLDISNLEGDFLASDEGSRIAISVISCDIATAGFCSPFVHEQANIREAQDNVMLDPMDLYKISELGMQMDPGFSHGGTHVHAPAVILDVPPQQNVSYEFDVEVPMIVNDPGTFFMIGTLQFFTGENPDSPVYRYDVSNAIPGEKRLVKYQDPPMIYLVTPQVQIVSYVAIGIVCSVILFLMYHTIKYYKSQVMKMSQVSFLLVFLLSALTATISSVLLQPKSDLWCNLSHPMVLIPLQVLYGITLGRLWRVHAVISPLLRRPRQPRDQRQQKPQSNWCCILWIKMCFQRIFYKSSTTTNASSRRKSGGIRQEISPMKVTLIVIACTAPQVVIQILAWVLQPASKVTELNSDQSLGRDLCDDGFPIVQSLRNYGLCFLLALVLLVIVMAHAYRDLPSLLNESTIIYNSTLSSLFLVVLGAGVTMLINNPTTSPDIPYITNVLLILSITLNSSLRTMLPKLQMVWKGETILVHEMVRAHRSSMNQSSKLSSSAQTTHISGLNMPPTGHLPPGCQQGHEAGSSQAFTSPSRKKESSTNSNESLELSFYAREDDLSDLLSGSMSHGVVGDRTGTPGHASSQDLWVSAVEGEGSSKSTKSIVRNAKRLFPSFATRAANKTKKQGICIRPGQVPSQRLLLKMVDMKNELNHVTNQIMSGFNVELNDWKALKGMSNQMESIFADVEFADWDDEESHHFNEDDTDGDGTEELSKGSSFFSREK